MIRTYWDILGRYKWSIVVCPVLVLVFVVCETLQPMLMARIVDEGVMHRDIAVVTRIGIWMLGISVAGLLANITNVFVSSNASVGFATELRSRLFRKIQEFSFAEMDKFNSASLITRLTGDVTRLQQVVLLGLRILLRSPMMLVMAFFYVVRIDSGLALIVAGAIPVLGISVYLILRKGFPYFLKMQQKVDAVNAVVRENLINMRVVKSFVRERYESRKFSASNRDLCDVSVKASNIIVTIFPVMQLVLNLSVIVVLWVGGERVAAGRLQVGELVSLVNYLMQILMSLMMLSMIIMNIARASASSDRVLEVLGTEPSLKDSPGASAVVRRGAVEFRNVSFRYGGGETDVLHGISFSVAPGMTVAVAGATGSGKSTLLQLVPRLYDTTGGEVLIDGTDVRDYPLAQLHAQVGMVLQNNVLFSGTIADNLALGQGGCLPGGDGSRCPGGAGPRFRHVVPGRVRYGAGARRGESLRRAEAAALYCPCAAAPAENPLARRQYERCGYRNGAEDTPWPAGVPRGGDDGFRFDAAGENDGGGGQGTGARRREGGVVRYAGPAEGGFGRVQRDIQFTATYILSDIWYTAEERRVRWGRRRAEKRSGAWSRTLRVARGSSLWCWCSW